MNTFLTTVSLLVISTYSQGYGGNEERFIKKYAMMKVYESCFGPEVLKEVRREMKLAAEKCSGFHHNFDDKFLNEHPIKVSGNGNFGLEDRLNGTHHDIRPSKPHRNKLGNNKIKKPIHSADTFLLQQWMDSQKTATYQQQHQQPHPQPQPQPEKPRPPPSNNSDEEEVPYEEDFDDPNPPAKPSKPSSNVDMDKLQEAINSYQKPANPYGQPQQQQTLSRPAYTPSSQHGYQPPQSQAPQQGYQGYYPPMYYPGAYPAPQSYAYPPYPGYPYPGYYPNPPPPYYSQQPQGSPNGYYRHRTSKISKEFDVKAQIDAMTFHSGAKMRNITCVMQELGYLDDNLEPNYEKMTERINRLNVPAELKKDMTDGVEFCRQFAQCVPEMRNDKFQLSRELLRPMFFFRCYKHKKLEACIMKDVRERFTPATEDHSVINNEIRRSFPRTRDDIASTIYEYMYGANNEDLDSLL